jgi:hypothetical protein
MHWVYTLNHLEIKTNCKKNLVQGLVVDVARTSVFNHHKQRIWAKKTTIGGNSYPDVRYDGQRKPLETVH